MTDKPKAFQAYAAGCSAVAPSPKGAAMAFFDRYPTKRKCNLIEGTSDGHFFTVRFGRSSLGEWPQSWKNVTRKMVAQLPDA